MSDLIVALLVLTWVVVGAWGLCKAFRYEADLEILDAVFAICIGSLFGPLSLLILFCEWANHRSEPFIIAKKIER